MGMTPLAYQLKVEEISLAYVTGEIGRTEYLFRMQSLQEQYYAMERKYGNGNRQEKGKEG